MAKYEKSFKGDFDRVLKLLDDEIMEVWSAWTAVITV